MQTIYKIHLPKLFNWRAILSYLNRDPNEPMYQVFVDRVRRAFQYNKTSYLVEISYHRDYLAVKLLNDVNNLSVIKTQILPFIQNWFAQWY